MSVYGGLVPLGFSHSKETLTFAPIFCVYVTTPGFKIQSPFSSKKGLYFFSRRATMFLLFGEAGVIPARARRRKARLRVLSYHAAACRGTQVIGGQPSEKAERISAKSEYPAASSFLFPRGAGTRKEIQHKENTI